MTKKSVPDGREIRQQHGFTSPAPALAITAAVLHLNRN
jgi:hypothetical protein